MSEMTDYPTAKFCWPELVASDADVAKEFYANLFGWSINDVPVGNDQVYSMASIDGKEVGALYQMWPELEGRGVPTHWGNYVSVTDIEESVKKASSLGGQIIVETMDVFDAGRMSAIVDPGGAVFSLLQPMKHIGARLVNEHGALLERASNVRHGASVKLLYRALRLDFSGYGYGRYDLHDFHER